MGSPVRSKWRQRIPQWWGFNFATLFLVVAPLIAAVVLLWPVSWLMCPDPGDFVGDESWKTHQIPGEKEFSIAAERAGWIFIARVNQFPWWECPRGSYYSGWIDLDLENLALEDWEAEFSFYPENFSVEVLIPMSTTRPSDWSGEMPHAELMDFGKEINDRLKDRRITKRSWRPFGWVFWKVRALPAIKGGVNDFLIWLA